MLNEKDSLPQETQESNLYKYTNHENSHMLDNLLAMFCHGVFTNVIGIMQALNETTGEEEVLLVGVKQREDGTQDCFPLAKVLKSEEVVNYSAPDGEGGWNKLGGDNGLPN